MEKLKLTGSGSRAFGPARLYWREGAPLRISLAYRGAYGLGERFVALNQKGRRAVCEVEEKFCFQGGKTYCPAPFFWTDSGFGLYADTCESTAFDFREGEIIAELPKNCVITLFSGTPESMIAEYLSLFGSPVLPPDWAFGPWISANRWSSQADVENAVAEAERLGFPVSALVIEAWSDEATFYIWRGAKYTPKPDGAPLSLEDFDFSDSPWPDPAGMIRRLHEKGIRVLLWQAPVYKALGPDEPENEQHRLDCADAVRRGLCVHNADGSPYTIPEGHWFPGSMIPDFTNPETRRVWLGKRRYLLEMGIDGFKTDGGEFIYSDDVRFFDGSTGREGKNRYARDYAEAYASVLGPEQALFSRAGFAGQHRTPLLWAGDQQSVNSEFRSALTAGLSAACSGIAFWGFDIAGFAGPLPTPDLYRRATQLACFCPVMQWHSEPDGGQFRELMPGAEGNNERSPWNMERAYALPGFAEEMRFWHELRVKLLPYLLKTARECAAENRPMLRPLVYYWPGDARAADCADEFLLGRDILVAPLLEENAARRRVYLPEGEWRDFFTGEAHIGPAELVCPCEGRLPVFARACFELKDTV